VPFLGSFFHAAPTGQLHLTPVIVTFRSLRTKTPTTTPPLELHAWLA
jgi:hypothetical protein